MNPQLQNRDYYLLIDKSGSMGTRDASGNGKTRWQICQEGTQALAAKIEELDPDGISLYTFASAFKRYDNVTAAKVADVFKENEPNGSTNLTKVLDDAFNDYFTVKSSGKSKANGAMFLIVTDGEPDDRQSVARSIIAATQKMDRDEELALSFIQIGEDVGATQFLQFLDDGLQAQGAKFDIVDTITAKESENITFTELLTKAITD